MFTVSFPIHVRVRMHVSGFIIVFFFYLRAIGRKVLWSSACVCLSVCVCVCLCVCAHCFCPQDISRTGSWITTKFGGWEQGVNL